MGRGAETSGPLRDRVPPRPALDMLLRRPDRERGPGMRRDPDSRRTR